MIELDESFDWVKAMQDCHQDALWHAEGNVLTHTRMVCEHLQRDPNYHALAPTMRETMLTAAKLHDVGKPRTTKTEPDGRITSKHHAWRGSVIARRLLWELNVPFGTRELICNLVRFHMRPFHFLQKPQPIRDIAEVSLSSQCYLHAMLSTADTNGRMGNGIKESFECVDLFRLAYEEANCSLTPHWFASPHSRFHYFKYGTRPIADNVYDDTWEGVIVMSGLPGAGKDYWIKARYPDMAVVSLDQIRQELDIHPKENQGKVVAAAQDKAKQHLRKKRPFIWNATNVTKSNRSDVIDLVSDYKARVKIVYVEADKKTLFEQNADREHKVPEDVMHDLIDKWEVPTLTECHEVKYVAQGIEIKKS